MRSANFNVLPNRNNMTKNKSNEVSITVTVVRLPVVGTLKRYSKALEYEYRVKTAALGTLKRYSIISLTLYL
jgi:hypothetical protein